MMRMRQLSVALTLALSAAEAGALGFGEIEVRSRLNEPLDAWIRIASADAEELATLSVRLAGAEEYARLGLRRQAVPVAIEFTVERDREDRPVVRARSRQPVREPLLPLLVDAQWSKGRMLREFVVLLDPPLTVPAVAKAPPARPARVEAPPAPARRETVAAPPEAQARVPEAAPQAPPAPPVSGPTAQAEPPKAAEPVPPPQAAEPAPPTQAAEPAPPPSREAERPAPTLPGGEYGPVAAGETLWQIALATRPAEADVQQMLVAIFEANPSAFINGNLNLLRRGAVLRIPSAEEVRAIDRAAARRLLAEHSEAWLARRGAGAPTQVAAPVEPPPVLAAREERRERARQEPARREDRLAILPPAGEETRPAANARGGGLPARDAEIEGLRADLQRSRESLAVAEQELAELRSRVRELEAIESDQQRLIALKDSELANLRQRLAELEERLRQAQAGSGGVEPQQAAAPAPAPVEPAPPVQPVPTPAPAPAVAPQPQPAAAPPAPEGEARPWYLRPPVLGGGVAILLLILALAWLARRRGTEAPGEKSLASRLVAAAPPAPAATEERLKELKAAVEADPTDLQAHLALLRFLYNREDAVAFEIAAESMAGYVGEGASPEWEEVMMMGREIAPEHPLFRRSSGAPAVAAAVESTAAPPSPAPTPEPLQPPQPASPAPAFPELELPAWQPEAEDIAARAEESPAATPIEDTVTTQRLHRAELDLRGDWDTQRISQADIDRAMADRTPAASGIALGDSDDDVVATKLDLAREYLDLGDADGARGLLEEVLSEGSAAQKAEAQRLLAQIR